MKTYRWLCVVMMAGACEVDPVNGTTTQAATGDLVTVIELPTEARCPAIGTSLATVPAAAIDSSLSVPTLIATSCYTETSQRSEIYYLNPATNPATLVQTISTPTVSDRGWGALALRGDHGDLIGCTNNLDGHHDVYAIDLHTGATTFLFAATEATSPDMPICDGIAWDALTQHVYVNPSVSTQTYVYDARGALATSFPTVNIACRNNSGMAVSGDSIFHACGGDMVIVDLDKSTPTTEITHFPSGDIRAEDVECDPDTFASQHRQVLWTRDAYNSELDAVDLPYGACNSGGLPPPPRFAQLAVGETLDQTLLGDCSGATLPFSKPRAYPQSAVISCTPIAGSSFGAHDVTCVATDSFGQVSEPVSFTVTVLPPLTLRIQAPLSGDSTPSMPDGSVDNVVKSGSVVPVNLKLYTCGTDVTTSAAVSMHLDVGYRASSLDPPNNNVAISASGVGDTSGVMTLTDDHYHYNLSTKGYQQTAGNTGYFAVRMTATYVSTPTMVVGSDTIRLETR